MFGPRARQLYRRGSAAQGAISSGRRAARLFLDEITEMPVDLQGHAGRVLETGLFMRVGTNREIAMTCASSPRPNRKPEEAVAGRELARKISFTTG